jgi:predicted DNA-binding protein YlxM (UPF0122 family)
VIGAVTFSSKARAEDIAVLMYARLGFSLEVIAANTHLSKAAIAYRLKVMRVKIRDYRNGTSPLAQQVIKVAHRESQEIFTALQHQIEQQLHLQLPDGSSQSVKPQR